MPLVKMICMKNSVLYFSSQLFIYLNVIGMLLLYSSVVSSLTGGTTFFNLLFHTLDKYISMECMNLILILMLLSE